MIYMLRFTLLFITFTFSNYRSRVALPVATSSTVTVFVQFQKYINTIQRISGRAFLSTGMTEISRLTKSQICLRAESFVAS